MDSHGETLCFVELTVVGDAMSDRGAPGTMGRGARAWRGAEAYGKPGMLCNGERTLDGTVNTQRRENCKKSARPTLCLLQPGITVTHSPARLPPTRRSSLRALLQHPHLLCRIRPTITISHPPSPKMLCPACLDHTLSQRPCQRLWYHRRNSLTLLIPRKSYYLAIS